MKQRKKMTMGSWIPKKDKECPDCWKDGRIIDRDSSAVVFKCKCGKKWTVFYEMEL